MKAQYIRAMDAVHAACLFVAGTCLVVITIIVPYGVFTRYALNSAASWPEPMAVLLMIVLSFLSAVVCYREHLHIGVGLLPAVLKEPAKSVLGLLLEICMLATNLFMVVWGIRLVETTWYQSIAEFPIATAGMSERLVNLAKVFVGFIRGGMALVNIIASTMFGCISGSSVADTAAVGSVMIPQMIKNGYPRLFAVNVTISGSLQPLLLPPSHNMIIYSIAAGGTISVAHLFMAGIIPALLLGLSLIILVLIIAYRNEFPRGEIVPLGRALKIALDAVWGMVTIAIILGGILSGVFTPTEAGAVAVVYAFL